MADDDRFNLQRFVDAQADGVYEQALSGRRPEAIFGGLDGLKFRSLVEIFGC